HLPHFVVDLLPLFFAERLGLRTTGPTAADREEQAKQHQGRCQVHETHRFAPWSAERERRRAPGNPAPPASAIAHQSFGRTPPSLADRARFMVACEMLVERLRTLPSMMAACATLECGDTMKY